MSIDMGVPETFAGKNVFLTGGSGFVGKVLIEKLLRSCPQIAHIYVLIRSKRNTSISDRLVEISKLALFDKLHKERPGDFAKKVIPIEGDVSAPNLGISPGDRATLIDNVHLVYHVAATVKFDQALRDAILMNVRGTHEVCELVLEMRRCELVMHVSTAYAHTQHNPIEECMYEPTCDWRKALAAAEKLDGYALSKMQAHFMGPYPNTYTFTKGIAERVVHDKLHGRVANMIVRPSIVISTLRDPMPGWIDNFNGPVGMLAANGTGLVRINLVKDTRCDFLPVDLVVRAMINATWHRLTHAIEYKPKGTSVHNCSAYEYSKLTAYDVADIAHGLAETVPLSTCVWYPSARRTQNQTVFNTYFLLLHVLPALFFDGVLRMLQYRPVVLMIQRRIFVAVNALKYFILNEWAINHHSLKSLEYKLPAKDREDFGYNAEIVDYPEYLRLAMLGGMEHLLKEDMSQLKANRTRIRILKYVDIIFTICLYTYLAYLFIIKWNLLGVGYDYLSAYLIRVPVVML